VACRGERGRPFVTHRIGAVEAVLLHVPLDRAMQAYGSSIVSVVLATVRDEEGRVGTGFTYTLNQGATVVTSMIVDVLAPLVVGTELDDWPATVAGVKKQTRRLGPAVFVPALSALDIAVWDLKAVEANLPLYALLGRQRTTAAMYGSGRSSNSLSLHELVAGCMSYVDIGLSAIKLRIGARSPDEDGDRIRRVREAVGTDVTLMVDCNEQLSRSQAISLIPFLEECGIDWIEEPFPAEDVIAHAELAHATFIPIAAGEHLVGRHQFAEYLREGAATVWQPDAALTGGVTTALEVAELAADSGIPIAYHSLPELNVHLTMGDANVRWVEHFPILDPILTSPLVPADGLVTAPNGAGHGMEWDRDAIRFHTVARAKG
jgi:L-alanine-DL-glutamate epimerase-like enolase superfamily enzyme